jgi:hypothetical protein
MDLQRVMERHKPELPAAPSSQYTRVLERILKNCLLDSSENQSNVGRFRCLRETVVRKELPAEVAQKDQRGELTVSDSSQSTWSYSLSGVQKDDAGDTLETVNSLFPFRSLATEVEHEYSVQLDLVLSYLVTHTGSPSLSISSVNPDLLSPPTSTTVLPSAIRILLDVDTKLTSHPTQKHVQSDPYSNIEQDL